MSCLVLVRHGQTDYNKAKRMTGRANGVLTQQGIEQAKILGRVYIEHSLTFDHVFSSTLKRSFETARHSLEASSRHDHLYNEADKSWFITQDHRLDERDVGDVTGMTKQQAIDVYGELETLSWRESYDVCAPNGESVKDVHDRTKDYLDERVMPLLKDNKTVLIVSHAITMIGLHLALGVIKEDNILDLNLPNGEAIIFNKTRLKEMRLIT